MSKMTDVAIIGAKPYGFGFVTRAIRCTRPNLGHSPENEEKVMAERSTANIPALLTHSVIGG